MQKYIVISVILLSVFVFNSCQNKTSENIKIDTSKEIKSPNEESVASEEKESSDPGFAIQSVDDELAHKIKNYLTSKFLKEADLRSIPKEERKFQLYKIDLNSDGKNEVFVNFLTSYFCGSGGCTILLLSNDLEPITKFTVTRTPLFAEQTIKNGWRILLTRSEGELKELTYNNGAYPSNPSMLEKAPYDAPSGHSEIMFDENFSKPKTYEF
ncbi:hypothetical protein [Winogradskyella aquimaris]|uniref:Lipoprotein n=1 Tax=Winogradskyella aquimaris TaxID=864074 RepID=A0ABU5EKB1_9FLAO|nr:hypothetical protein [Winogradskyella aquimaris]MDY2586821.1 hypothetical protein [Winogradskyella aquimaris]